MAKRLFHIPVVVSPDDPSVCTLQVAKAPLSAVGAPDPNGDPLPKTMSDVHIELWEADKLLPDGGKEDDLLATFVVDLALAKDGRVTVAEKDVLIEPMPEGHIQLGMLEVRLETGTGQLGPRHRIPIHGDASEWPHNRPGWAKPRATTELAITVKSDYPDETTRTTLNLLEQGFLPSGPVAAFICLQPHDATARRLAEKYWREHADLVRVAGDGFDGSLQEIAGILAGSGQVFQEVNIIAHGTEDGVNLFARVLDPSDESAGGGWISHHALRVEALGSLNASGAIDKTHTRVVVRGCTIGRDRRLLRALSSSFQRARVYAASNRVLYLYEPHNGAPEYYLLERYFTPVPGHVRTTYRGSAPKTSAVLSADDSHGTDVDFATWARHLESHWASRGVIPRYFRTARELEWSMRIDGVSSEVDGRNEFETALWATIQAGNSAEGLDYRYELATYERTVDPDAMSWSDPFRTWAAKHHWQVHDRFSKNSYLVELRRTHVVVEVLVTDPPDDPAGGTPVPLDLATHFVSEQA